MNNDFNLDDILSEYTSNKTESAESGRKSQSEKYPGAKPVQRSSSTVRSSVEARSAPAGRPSAAGRPVTSACPAAPTSRPAAQTCPEYPARSAGKRRKKKPHTGGIITAAVVIFLLIFVLLVSYGNRIQPNVSAGEISLGWMTGQKAYDTLVKEHWQQRTEKKLTVTTYGGATVEVDPVEAGLLLGTEDIVNRALRYGKEGNLLSNMRSFIRCLGRKTDLNALYAARNDVYLTECAALCQTRLNEVLGDPYTVDEERGELVMRKGQGSLYLNTTELKERIWSALQSGEERLEYCGLLTEPVDPDLQVVHDLVYAEPQPAAFATDGTHSILEGKPGYDFDVTAARTLWDAAALGDEVRIPLQISRSEITPAVLESRMFCNLLGAMTTKYNNSGENRRSNVRLAASRVDGTVLFPGEEFSYNDVVGARTAEAGFLLAPAYAGYNDIKEEIGGGVCQVSSSLYAAALFSFLEISKHTCHVYPPNYIQLGTDATVTIPEGGGRTIDFRFVNNRNYPVRITAYCEETEDRGDGKPLRTVTVEIWGTLEEEDYMPVEFDNTYMNIYDYDRIIEPADPDREGYKIKFTHDEQAFEDDYGSGIRTATHRKVYDSKGNLVEDRIINPTYSAGYALDTYYFMQ